MSTSSSSSAPDRQISHKKPIKIKNELNEKRRHRLKEYYKLKQQQENLQKEANSLQVNNSDGIRASTPNSEIDLETEILENRTIEEIDLVGSDFETILTGTNRLTTSINLINSSIKNIIYNNYYELIKLNEFLGNLNKLDLSVVDDEKQGPESDQKVRKADHRRNNSINVLGRLSISPGSPLEREESSLRAKSSETNDLAKLNQLMDKIEEFDKDDYKSNMTLTNSNTENIQFMTTLLKLNRIENEQEKLELNKQLNKIIADLKKANGSSVLIHQFQDLQRLTT